MCCGGEEAYSLLSYFTGGALLLVDDREDDVKEFLYF